MTGQLGRVARGLHWLAVTASASGLALVTSAVLAEPAGGAPPSPYPDSAFILNYYNRVHYDDYFTSSAGGVWFSTPLGLNCGIWDRGAFGCAGDIRGAPPGTTHVGWVSGQIVMRYDPGVAVLFPPGRADRELAPRNYIMYNGTTCATMTDLSTYCNHGPFKFYVTPTRTLMSPP